MVKVIFARPAKRTVEEQPENSKRTAGEQLSHVPSSLKRLIITIGHDWLTAQELRDKMGFKSKGSFWTNYLAPAIEKGLVAWENEYSPKSPTQRYGLTELGRNILSAIQ